MEYNKELLLNLFRLWENKRRDWRDNYRSQISFFQVIRTNIPIINDYYKSLSVEKRNTLNELYPVKFFLWKAYKDSKIDLNTFHKLNKEVSVKKYKKTEDETVQRELLQRNNIDDDYISTLDKERADPNYENIGWFFEQNKEYYARMLNDERVKEILDAMYEVFRSNNSQGSTRGGPRRIINQVNSLVSLFELFQSYDIFNFEQMDNVCLNIFGADKFIKEVFGFYHLAKKESFIYNGRVNKLFKLLFQGFDEGGNELSKVTPFYKQLTDAFLLFFKDDIFDSNIYSILDELHIELKGEEKENLNVNLQVDQMIYCYNPHEEGEDPTISPNDSQSACIAKNRIFYGPPGTGKTFITKLKAIEIIMGKKSG